MSFGQQVANGRLTIRPTWARTYQPDICIFAADRSSQMLCALTIRAIKR
jgi:hypothetical protein